MHDDCVVYIRKVTRVKEILDGKWKLQILCAMRSGPVRLSQLTRLAPAASKKGLRANLRSLESSHIVVRRDLSDSVLHVEYDFEDKRARVCLFSPRSFGGVGRCRRLQERLK
jgi:DNA-binding HxlR family transcriptional regulator